MGNRSRTIPVTALTADTQADPVMNSTEPATRTTDPKQPLLDRQGWYVHEGHWYKPEPGGDRWMGVVD